MKAIVLLLILVLVVPVANARSFTSGVVTGAIGGAVAGAVIAESAKSKSVNSPPVNKRVPVGRTIIECRLNRAGGCYNFSKPAQHPAQYVASQGFRYIHWQELVRCGDSFCLLMEVSK